MIGQGRVYPLQYLSCHHILRALKGFLRGLKHQPDPAGKGVSFSFSIFAAVSSMAVWKSWPQAFASVPVEQVKLSPLSSGMGGASISARSRSVLPPAQFGGHVMPAGVRVQAAVS